MEKVDNLILRCMKKCGMVLPTLPIPAHTRAMTALFVASSLWVRQIPENDDTRDLRDQLVNLEKTGAFKLE